MFPLKDNLRYLTFPWATVTIATLNILVFVCELSFKTSGQFESTIHQWLLSRDQLLSALASGHPHALLVCLSGLFVPMFLHGGFEHIFGNMCFFFAFAPAVEARMGWKRFTIFYLTAGVLGNLAEIFTDPTGVGVGLGASGAIGGVLGAYLVLFPKAELEGWIPLSPIPLPFVTGAFFFVLDFVLQQAISVWTSIHNIAFAKAATIGFWAHAGGISFGMVVGLILVFCAWLRPPANPPVIVPVRPKQRSRYLFEIMGDVPVAVFRALIRSVVQALTMNTCIVLWIGGKAARFGSFALTRLGLAPAANKLTNGLRLTVDKFRKIIARIPRKNSV